MDDRSGFVEYSNHVIIDHRGRVTLPRFADPIHPMEMELPFKDDSMEIPFCRPDPFKGMTPDVEE